MSGFCPPSPYATCRFKRWPNGDMVIIWIENHAWVAYDG